MQEDYFPHNSDQPHYEMNGYECDARINALTYHSLGYGVVPVHTEDKKAALKTYLWWLYDHQETQDIHRIVYANQLDLGLIGGRPSGNAFFVDCETPEAFKEIGEALRRHVGPCPSVRSGRGGHYWLRAPFPVNPHSFTDWEIKGQGNYVLAPLSLHPSGRQYEFANEIRHAPVVTGLPFTSLEPKFTPKVSRFAHDMFRGRYDGKYESRSHADQAFILSLYRSGFSEGDIAKFLYIVEFQSKYKSLRQEGDDKGAAQYLAHSFKKARSSPDLESYLDAMRVIKRWEAWTKTEKWIGRSGAVDRSVFLAHLYCASSAGKLKYDASVRQLAELSQTSVMTASRANVRLSDLGLLWVSKRSLSHEPNIFQLNPDALTSKVESESVLALHTDMKEQFLYLSVCNANTLDPYLSVWERQGLGKAARLIWECLDVSRADYKAIAEASGRGIDTVKRQMPKLLGLGLIEKTGQGYKQKDNINWTAIAETLCTTELPVKRILKHQEQREHYNAVRTIDAQSKGEGK